MGKSATIIGMVKKGQYEGKPVYSSIHIGVSSDQHLVICDSEVSLGLLASAPDVLCEITPSTVESYEKLSEAQLSANSDRVADATFWFGIGAGLLASQLGKSTSILVAVFFKDGNKSLLELSDVGYNVFIEGMFLETVTNTVPSFMKKNGVEVTNDPNKMLSQALKRSQTKESETKATSAASASSNNRARTSLSKDSSSSPSTNSNPSSTQPAMQYRSLQNYKSGQSEPLGPYQPKSEKAGCYVATAVYGSYDCPQVWTLRRYRDYTLAETWYGRAFIRTYYAVSPTLVKCFGRTKLFKNLCKPKLDRMVKKLNSAGVKDTPYSDRDW